MGLNGHDHVLIQWMYPQAQQLNMGLRNTNRIRAVSVILFVLAFTFIRYSPQKLTGRLFGQLTCPGCQVYDMKGDASGFDYPCTQMKITPATTICLYPQSEDAYVSGAYYNGGVWEERLVRDLLAFLKTHPDCGLIDIGANIGTYTLPTASMGHNVLVVEPNLENVRRIHKAVSSDGHQDHVTVLVNAVSNKRGLSRLVPISGNVGGTSIEQIDVTPSGIYSRENYTTSITLDDVLPLCQFKMAVMKIDIEGSENHAFNVAEKRFDNIDIPYIQMEWVHVKKNGYDNASVVERDLFTGMMSFLLDRGYSPWSARRKRDLNVRNWRDWPLDITWMKSQIK